MHRYIVTVRQYGQNSDIFLAENSVEVTASNENEARQYIMNNFNTLVQQTAAYVNFRGVVYPPPGPLVPNSAIGARLVITKVQRIKGS